MPSGAIGSAAIGVCAIGTSRDADQFVVAATQGPQTYSGDYFAPQRRYRTREELRQERIRLGILPPEVVKAVAKTAKKSVKRATYRAERKVDYTPQLPPMSAQELIQSVGPVTGLGRDVAIWLALEAANRKRQLKAELKRQELEWHAAYEQAMQLEVERILQERQDDEDAQLLALMFQQFMH